MNINQSPFNLGLAIELPEFHSEQVAELARRHGLDLTNSGGAHGCSSLQALMDMIRGHPYLVRVALYNLAWQDMTLAELLSAAPTEAGPYGDHLAASPVEFGTASRPSRCIETFGGLFGASSLQVAASVSVA